jgi:hypothetical protein
MDFLVERLEHREFDSTIVSSSAGIIKNPPVFREDFLRDESPHLLDEDERITESLIGFLFCRGR